ncbi:YsnF/AvaK domain-containing protein [Enterobacteriaceae bacterium H20N1]|uniref:YsnF/AvaK domain-containing protein n=1 Tax=Dryocola boscaweniae TaxID=2925397 RepID=A0A9X3A9M6_9ENTR|nr:YsnF/AvaK domain-containing protein [Dryocola boscaweniae]MCT4700564.1 YsnF/AvaK domain-containing protein [Dryocola boscaweniae]MCT4717720.1 YsnF/AvaK domain-containing protein [Dryocola boscaweniae]
MSKNSGTKGEMSDTKNSVPLAEEHVEVGTKKVVDRRVSIRRTTRTTGKLIETDLTRENVLIKRLSKNEALEPGNIPQTRQEGEVTIIPVIEERIEIIKHYVLKEEIHIIKKVSQETYQENIILRSQEINISTEDE